MIPRYRGKVTGGRQSGHRRRHRLAILIELARFASSLMLLYAALVCAVGAALWLANRLDHPQSARVAGVPVLRQLAIQSDLVSAKGEALLAIGLIGAPLMLLGIHLLANLLVDDLVDR